MKQAADAGERVVEHEADAGAEGVGDEDVGGIVRGLALADADGVGGHRWPRLRGGSAGPPNLR